MTCRFVLRLVSVIHRRRPVLEAGIGIVHSECRGASLGEERIVLQR